jgi:hypothetical protein
MSLPTVEQMARAMRAYNVEGHGHPMKPWDETDERVRALWLERADRLMTYIDREEERNPKKRNPFMEVARARAQDVQQS